MDSRRLADLMKILGALVGGIGTVGGALKELGAWLPPGKIAAAMITAGGAGLFVAGWATRFIGTEYQDVADAKAVAKVASSIMPPPLPTIPGKPPTA